MYGACVKRYVLNGGAGGEMAIYQVEAMGVKSIRSLPAAIPLIIMAKKRDDSSNRHAYS